MSAPTTPRPDRIAGPAGGLEVIVEAPAQARGAAVVCHPHPLYHGTMTNKVVHTLARSFNDLGLAALRFNFRGVGSSDGEYDGGRGETDDALAVLEHAGRSWPGPLWLAGFSFGAFVALRAALRARVSGLVTVAPPVGRFDLSTLEQPRVPWLIVQGEDDELVEAEAVVEWVNALEPGPALVVLPGVDHFFHGRLRELRQRIIENLSGHLEPD